MQHLFESRIDILNPNHIFFSSVSNKKKYARLASICSHFLALYADQIFKRACAHVYVSFRLQNKYYSLHSICIKCNSAKKMPTATEKKSDLSLLGASSLYIWSNCARDLGWHLLRRADAAVPCIKYYVRVKVALYCWWWPPTYFQVLRISKYR